MQLTIWMTIEEETLTLMNKFKHYSFQGVDFLLDDRDLWLPYYGGNKARKLMYAKEDIKSKNKNAIVTTGGIQSNHCRVTSLYAAENNFECVIILHGNKEDFFAQKGNALLMRMSGADCRFVDSKDIGPAMDQAMNELEKRGYNPYYLYGGGHNEYGVKAFSDAVIDLKRELGDDFADHIFVASGTGSTQAGILVGLYAVGNPNTKVHGISVARKKERGIAGVLDAISMVDSNLKPAEVNFYDNYLFGGYNKTEVELTDFVETLAAETGIIADTTYTGKALWGMLDIVKKEKLNGKILFWHTGGILNLMA